MIKSLRLQNFKNFRDATLELGKLTVLVGANASGKSNLRDAFRFIHGMARGYTLSEIIGEKWIEGGVLQWKGIRGGTREAVFLGQSDFTLVTTMQIEDGEAVHSIMVDVGRGNEAPRVVSESLRLNDQLVFDTHPADDPIVQGDPEILEVRLHRDGQNRKLGKRIKFVAHRPVLSQVSDRKNTTLWAMYISERVTAALASMRFLDLTVDAMRIPSLPGQDILGDRGENLSSVLQAICARSDLKAAIMHWIAALTPLDVTDLEFSADQTGKVLLSLVEADGRRLSAHSASDGTLRFLAMIAALLGPHAADFYFFEELENGIHPTRLHLLLQLIEQQVRDGTIQVVATTHSPLLLGLLSAEARESASLVYRLEHAQEGRIKRIMEIPETRRVLEGDNLAHLHDSGWLEDAVAFLETEGAAG